MSDYGKDVRISITKSPTSDQWDWEATVTLYGYEYNYLSAEGMVRDKLREMGVDA